MAEVDSSNLFLRSEIVVLLEGSCCLLITRISRNELAYYHEFCTLIGQRTPHPILSIGHLHDGVILLLRPESFSFFYTCLNLVIPARFK